MLLVLNKPFLPSPPPSPAQFLLALTTAPIVLIFSTIFFQVSVMKQKMLMEL